MPEFHCPVCGGALRADGSSLRCPAGHCYDRAKQGYVNLLMSNASSARRHGDDRAMVEARSAFLDQGYYRPILDGVLRASEPFLRPGADVLDAGCGEGWYTRGLLDLLAERGIPASVCGVDISRDAVKAAARRLPGTALAVASVSRLPLAGESCDLVWSLFSPLEAEEYRRVLRPGGVLLRAVPLERHLWRLKAAVYDRPYLNDPPSPPPEGWTELPPTNVSAPLTLTGAGEIRSLFRMTPYYYKTGAADQAKLDALNRLETGISVRIQVWKKESKPRD
jgi:23S rRNA (guanine745-N1)-methyltransferase